MTGTRTAARSHPLYTAVALTAATMALTITAAVLLGSLAPGLEPTQHRFIAVLVLAIMATAAVAATNRTLFTSGSIHARLLIIPSIIVLAPFAGGLKNLGFETGWLLVAGYLATGVYEELWFRGLVLKTLETWTPVRAALLSSGLFGLAHLSNIAFGADPAVTAAQVVGAACFGVGLAALRLRGMNIWPLIVLHAVGDIALQFGDITSAWRWANMIGGDTALLIFGLIILRDTNRRRTRRAAPGRGDPSPSEDALQNKVASEMRQDAR